MDRYVKVRKIGEGSFGKALLVRNKDDNKHFVIKEVNMTKMNRKEREESKKEVKVLSQMHHPNIVAYRESFQEMGNMFIVMDYCDGGDLYAKISSQRVPFPEDKILDWFVQLCLAVKHVHDRKILHRDIKSQNIFLTKGGIVKLGDFGIARVLNSTMELARTCIGTPYYLSPEICENKPYNNKSDIWAMGCVLYELATLKHPFESGNMRNLVLKIIRGSYPPVSTTYSHELRGLVVKCFKRSPRDRPSVNAILKMSFVQKRIETFLSQSIISDEFSHTILHRRPPPPSSAAPPPKLAAKKPDPRPAPAKRIGPAAIYGAPVRQPPRRPVAAAPQLKRPSGGDGPRAAALRLKQRQDQQRRGEQAAAIDKKKREIEERDRKRKEELRQQKEKYEEGVKLQQHHMAERQKLARIQKARAEAAQQWQKTLTAPESRPLPPPPSAPSNAPSSPKRLPEKKETEKQPAPLVQPGQPNNPRPFQQPRIQRPVSAVAAYQAADIDKPVSSERAKMVRDFLDRRKAAAANKAKAQIQLGRQHGDLAKLQNMGFERANPSHADGSTAKNDNERDYLARLEAIRRNNFRERHAIMMKNNPKPMAAPSNAEEQNQGSPFVARGHPDFDPEARRRKIAALKAQADMKAAQLREHLGQKKKRDEEERLKKAKEPVISLEVALKEVGVTRVLEQPSDSKMEQESAPEARKKWAHEPSKPTPLAQKSLEETASVMEATSDADCVEIIHNQRKKWADPATPDVVKMHGFDLQMTHTIDPSAQQGDQPDHPKPFSLIKEEKVEVKAAPEPTKGPVSVKQVLDAADAPQVPGEGKVDEAKKDTESDAEVSQAEPGEEVAAVEGGDIYVEDIEDEVSEVSVKAVEAKKDEESASAEAVAAESVLENKESSETVTETREEEKEDSTSESDEEESNFDRSMSEGLKTGAFDSNTRFLRTCSMPDLSKFKDETPPGDFFLPSTEEPDEVDAAPVDDDAGDVLEPNADEAVDGEMPLEEAEVLPLSSDEEDMQEMLATMANVLQEAGGGGGGGGGDVRDAADEGSSDEEGTQFGDDDMAGEPEALNESWQSDGEGDGSDGESGSEDASSVFNRLELTRLELEKELGFDKFMKVYRFIQTIQEEGDDEMSVGTETVDEISKMFGNDTKTAYPKILKLVTADAAYFEANDSDEISGGEENRKED